MQPGPALPRLDLPPALADHPKFRIVKQLGQGGMGTVYLAEHKVMERPVAIKVVSRALLDHPDALKRFFAEVRAAAKLNHPNIVAAYDAEPAGDLHLLAMEYVEGMNLADYLAQKGPLPIEHACAFARQTALGLQHAFEQGMVHRDIKPQNLMLTRKGQVKILDFGLARLASEQQAGKGITKSNAFMGTPEYVAPEQATDARQADIRADIYSLGCTLYALLTGHAPFEGGTAVQLILAHLEKTPEPIETKRSDVPPGLSAVLSRMLAKKPEERYATPGEVAMALAPFCRKGEKTSATVPVATHLPPPLPAVTPPPQNTFANLDAVSPPSPKASRTVVAPPRRARQRSLAGVVVGCVVAVLVLGSIGIYFSSRPSSPPTKKSADPKLADTRPSTRQGWTALFNGKDFTGWKTFPSGPGPWTIDDGALIASNAPGTSHLFTERGDFTDFHLKLEAQVNDGGNGGVVFRAPFAAGLPPRGYEAQINVSHNDIHNRANRTGSLWNLVGPSKLVEFREVLAPANRWFTFEVIAKGNQLTTKVNDTTAVDYFDAASAHRAGHIALQCWTGITR